MSAVAVVRALRTRGIRRATLVAASVVALGVAVALLALCAGRPVIAPGDALAALVGAGDATERFIVVELRLPRVIAAVLVGAAFGLAGAVFQSVLRNPLASPDVVGVTQGASAAAVVAVLGAGLAGAPVSLAAAVGGVAVAVLCLVLSGRSGASGTRFVLIGIAMAFLVNAITGYLLSRADIRAAADALVWLVGSVSTLPWDQLAGAGIGIALLAAAVGVSSARLRVLQLGPQLASGLGVRETRSRALLLLLAVGLVAIGIALAGPVAFVALAAPPIARALTGGGSAALAAAAAVGAVEVVAADLIAQNALPDAQVPAGVVTGVIGAPALLALLARRVRSSAVAP